MSMRLPAQGFPPGHFAERERKARGWSWWDMVRLLQMDSAQYRRFVEGEGPFDAGMVRQLSDAFGTSEQYWINLQTMWEEWRAAQAHA